MSKSIIERDASYMKSYNIPRGSHNVVVYGNEPSGKKFKTRVYKFKNKEDAKDYARIVNRGKLLHAKVIK